MTPDNDSPFPVVAELAPSKLDTRRNRMAVWLANAFLRFATVEYRRFVKGAIMYGLEAAAQERVETPAMRLANQGIRQMHLDLQADAWDEGYYRGVRDEAGEMERADNPYREGSA